MEGIIVASATAVAKWECLSVAFELVPGRTVVGTGSPAYTERGPTYVTVFDNYPRDGAPGLPGEAYPREADTIEVGAKATCSRVVTKSVVVPASAGGARTGESFANYAVYTVSSTLSISTDESPVAGTPDTTRGPTFITVVAVPERDPERIIGDVSLLVGQFGLFEEMKVE